MNSVKKSSTKRSKQLERMVQEMMDDCPIELGQEIIIMGSVGMGIADEESDVDIELWVEEIPEQKAAIEWIKSKGATEIQLDREASDEAISLIFVYQNDWVEASWHKLSSKQELVSEMMRGKNTSRLKNNQIYNIKNSIIVKTDGAIKEMREQLSHYPKGMQEKIIASSSEFWNYPHRVEMLWGLARRKEILGLTTWLQADVGDALRILYAVNREWEIDWKHIQYANSYLKRKPDQLEERIYEIFGNQDIGQRVKILQELILDILELVPEKIDVVGAMENIQKSLDKNR